MNHLISYEFKKKIIGFLQGQKKKEQVLENQSEMIQNSKITYWIVLNYFESFSDGFSIKEVSKSMKTIKKLSFPCFWWNLRSEIHFFELNYHIIWSFLTIFDHFWLFLIIFDRYLMKCRSKCYKNRWKPSENKVFQDFNPIWHQKYIFTTYYHIIWSIYNIFDFCVYLFFHYEISTHIDI